MNHVAWLNALFRSDLSMNSIQVFFFHEKGLLKAGIVFLRTGCLAFFGKCLCLLERFQDSRAGIISAFSAVVDLLQYSTLCDFISAPIGGHTSLAGDLLQRYDLTTIAQPMPKNGCFLQYFFITALCCQISRTRITIIAAKSKLHRMVPFPFFPISAVAFFLKKLFSGLEQIWLKLNPFQYEYHPLIFLISHTVPLGSGQCSLKIFRFSPFHEGNPNATLHTYRSRTWRRALQTPSGLR